MDQWNIRQNAEVRSADDEKLGKVIGTQGNYFIVEKGFFFPTDYYIPTSAISSVDGNTVYLSVTKDQALNSGWDQMGTETTTATGTGTTGRTTGTATAGAYDTTRTETGAEDVTRVPVYEEELTATKRPVEQGQVRVEKDVVTEQRAMDVPVSEERVRVTRQAVDRPADAAADAFQEETLEVPLRGEAVDVQKRVRQTEEVDVAKERVQKTQRVTGDVRREEVHVEDETTGGIDTSPGV